ncbi:ABC transporter substrate-binding protein [soil metagenome]
MKKLISAIAVAIQAFVLAGAAHAQSDGPIKLGQSAPMTGPAQELGQEFRAGALAYFNGINARGGVGGRTIDLVSLDDGYEPDRTIANTCQFIDKDGVVGLFGYIGTPTSNAALPLFTAAGVPFLGAFTGAESLRTPANNMIFNVRASYYDETERIVDHLAKLSITNIAVFYQDDAYGQTGLAGVERAMQRRNLKIVATGTVARNTTNVSEAVRRIGTVDPQAIVLISTYSSCAAFIKAMNAAGHNPTFANVSFVGSKALSRELGSSGRGVVITQVVPFPWDMKQALVREYQAAMKQYNLGDPSFTSLEGFLAAKVATEAIKRAPKPLTREGFARALGSIEDLDAVGLRVNLARSAQQQRYVDLTVIARDGSFLH